MESATSIPLQYINFLGVQLGLVVYNMIKEITMMLVIINVV